MKRALLLLSTITLVSGCARFATTQKDITYQDGKAVHVVYTRASSHSFLESASKLQGWRAGNNGTQTAEVNALEQTADNQHLGALLIQLGQVLSKVP